ncbi:MAG TPA: heme-binding domain-containing protein [Anaerolineae bacterium]|nr:heme-binding domain-containing protein [Anaerolineae bacterium]
MKKRQRIIKVAAIILGVVVIANVVPWLLETNPSVVQEPAWDSPQTRALAQRACFDCHSNETVWPVYARIAPISWLVTWDTLNGRRHLNFSEWGVRRGEGDNETARVIQRGDMPPAYYIAQHPEAGLTANEKQQLIQGLQATLK